MPAASSAICFNRLIDFGDIQAVNQVECIDRAGCNERDILRNTHALAVNRANSTDSHHVVAAENRRDFRMMLEQLKGQVIRAVCLEIAVGDVFLPGGDVVRLQGIHIAVQPLKTGLGGDRSGDVRDILIARLNQRVYAIQGSLL